MFWHSVRGGLAVLLHWETYVVGLEYFILVFLPLIALGSLMERCSRRTKMASGIVFLFGMPVMQMIATVVSVLTLSPIILGFSNDAAWSLPWRFAVIAPSVFAKLVGVVTVASLIAAFLPLAGRLQSFDVLVTGAITLVFVVACIEENRPEAVRPDMAIIPGFWFATGILIVAGTGTWLGFMLSGIVVVSITGSNEDLGMLLMMPLASAFGFLPVFIYGAWLGMQMRP